MDSFLVTPAHSFSGLQPIILCILTLSHANLVSSLEYSCGGEGGQGEGSHEARAGTMLPLVLCSQHHQAKGWAHGEAVCCCPHTKVQMCLDRVTGLAVSVEIRVLPPIFSKEAREVGWRPLRVPCQPSW